MSGGIEEPYTIARLPSPLDAEHGRILAAPVHSLSASRKRKRHEIAVAVDGESVNIYNIQNQSLSSSYPLPPQSYLAAPPCSVYCKRAKPLSSHRQTYFATRDAPHDRKLRLTSITEDLGKPRGDEREPRVPAKKERKLRAGNIISLDVVQSESGTVSSVLVSYDNGDVDCLSGDLSGTRWEDTGDTEGLHVEHAVVLDFATARRGLLKGREDVVATLDQTAHTGNHIHALPLLLQILRSGSQRRIRVAALRNAQGDSLQTHRSPMEELVVYNLPGTGISKDKQAKYEFHPGTGMLYQHQGGRLNVLDLSGTLPRLVAELGHKGTPRVNGFARLSSTTVFTVNSDRLAVCEIGFSSILSSLDYPSAESDGSKSSLRIVSQSTELGIVVALSDSNLLAFQVGDILDDGRRARGHGPLLIDVLGKGSKLSKLDNAKVTEKQLKKRTRLNNWKAKIDALICESDIDALEALVAQDLHIRQDDVLHDEQATGLTNGVNNPSKKSSWELPPPAYDPQHTDAKKALHILGSLFVWRANEGFPELNSPKLSIKFLPRNVLRWLAMAGYMTRTQIAKALRDSPGEGETKRRVAQGDVVSALKDADPSFTTICDLFSLPIHWDLAEVVRGLQLLIRSFDANFPTPATGFLTGSSNDDDDVDMASGADEARLQAEVEAATKQLDEAQNMLDNGLTTRSRACQIFLLRLHAFPHADIARAMRALLSQEELIFFIAILRLELGDAGWTKTYVEAEQAAEQEMPISSIDNPPDLEPSNHAIRTIADLCSCAIDAVGLSGWVVGLSGDLDETARLISETRNEVSAAAEGLVGVEVVETMLREVMKTAGLVRQKSHQRKRKRRHEEELASEEPMLPLGGRLNPKSWKTQNDLKSKQAIWEEQNRNVGKYSFEQIRL